MLVMVVVLEVLQKLLPPGRFLYWVRDCQQQPQHEAQMQHCLQQQDAPQHAWAWVSVSQQLPRVRLAALADRGCCCQAVWVGDWGA